MIVKTLAATLVLSLLGSVAAQKPCNPEQGQKQPAANPADVIGLFAQGRAAVSNKKAHELLVKAALAYVRATQNRKKPDKEARERAHEMFVKAAFELARARERKQKREQDQARRLLARALAAGTRAESNQADLLKAVLGQHAKKANTTEVQRAALESFLRARMAQDAELVRAYRSPPDRAEVQRKSLESLLKARAKSGQKKPAANPIETLAKLARKDRELASKRAKHAGGAHSHADLMRQVSQLRAEVREMRGMIDALRKKARRLH